MKIGEILKNERKKKKLTQEQLAKKCYLSPKTIFNFEKNISTPKYDDLNRIANALQISISVFNNEENKQITLTNEEYEEIKKAIKILEKIIK